MTILIIVFFVLLLINTPIAFVIGLAGTAWFFQHTEYSINVAVQRVVAQTQSIAFLAVPFFILAGNLMNRTGITKHLISFSRLLTRRMAGGMAQVSVVLSTLMGGVSGSAVADASMEDTLLLTPIFLPVLREMGVDPVHFGIVMMTMVTMGCMTPPVGTALYIVCDILDCPVEVYFKETVPFYVTVILLDIFLIFIPGIVMWLPNLVYGQ